MEILPIDNLDYVTGSELNMIRLEISPDGDEIEKFGITQENGQIRVTKIEGVESYVKDCLLNSWAMKYIQELLRDKNDKHKLHAKDLSLYEKFIVAYDQV